MNMNEKLNDITLNYQQNQQEYNALKYQVQKIGKGVERAYWYDVVNAGHQYLVENNLLPDENNPDQNIPELVKMFSGYSSTKDEMIAEAQLSYDKSEEYKQQASKKRNVFNVKNKAVTVIPFAAGSVAIFSDAVPETWKPLVFWGGLAVTALSMHFMFKHAESEMKEAIPLDRKAEKERQNYAMLTHRIYDCNIIETVTKAFVANDPSFLPYNPTNPPRDYRPTVNDMVHQMFDTVSKPKMA